MGYSMINIAVPGTVRTSTVRITVSYDIIIFDIILREKREREREEEEEEEEEEIKKLKKIVFYLPRKTIRTAVVYCLCSESGDVSSLLSFLIMLFSEQQS